MPGNMHVEIEGRAYDIALSRVQGAPSTLARIVETHVRPAVQGVVERDLVPYPPPIAPGVFKRLATPKQRRFVMRKIRAGEWTGRTGALGRSWIVRVTPIATGAILDTGSTAPKARFVVGRHQQKFHFVTGWPTLGSREFDIQAAARTGLRAGYRAEYQRTTRRGAP